MKHEYNFYADLEIRQMIYYRNFNVYNVADVEYMEKHKDLILKLMTDGYEFTERGLATYLDKEDAPEVKSILIGLCERKGRTMIKFTVITSKAISDDSYCEVEQYIEAQLSDGWGENGWETSIDGQDVNIICSYHINGRD